MATKKAINAAPAVSRKRASRTKPTTKPGTPVSVAEPVEAPAPQQTTAPQKAFVLLPADRRWRYYLVRVGSKFLLDLDGALTGYLSDAKLTTMHEAAKIWAELAQLEAAGKEWTSKPVVEVLVVSRNGVVTGTKSIEQDNDDMDSAGDQARMELQNAGWHNLALSEAAIYESLDQGDRVLAHAHEMKFSPMWPAFLARYEEEKGEMDAVMSDDFPDYPLLMLVGRALYAGIILGRRENGARNKRGELIFDNPHLMKIWDKQEEEAFEEFKARNGKGGAQ